MDANVMYEKYGIRSINIEHSYVSADSWGVKPWNSSAAINRTLTIKLNEDALKGLLRKVDEWEELSKKYYSELYIREKNSAVQKAYEKYQMFLELARSENQND